MRRASKLRSAFGAGVIATVGMVGFASMTPSRRMLQTAGAGIYSTVAMAPVREIGKGGLLGAEVSARNIWSERGAIVLGVRRAGCPMQRDQAYRLQHAPEFAGVPVYAMLNEVVDDEPEQFSVDTGISEERVFFDRTKAFFPEKSDGALGLLSFSVLRNTFRALSAGHGANGTGDYSYKGGIYVIGPGDQGILYHYTEDTYGELADESAIAAAIAKFNPTYQSTSPSPLGSDGGDGPVNTELADIERARL